MESDILKEFIDRIPTKPNRKKIIYSDNSEEYVTIESADEPNIGNEGTDVNRANLMAIQGFQACTTQILPNGNIVETNNDGHILTTTYNGDGTITQIFEGELTITKIITFSSGSISEVVI